MTKDSPNKSLSQIDSTTLNTNNDLIGNIALLATAVIKAAQFFTREGSATQQKNLRGSAIQSPSNNSESLLPPGVEKILNATPEELEKMANLTNPGEYKKFQQVVDNLHEVLDKLKSTQPLTKQGSQTVNQLEKLDKKIEKRTIPIKQANNIIKKAKKRHHSEL
ncbi:MAG: hypothetical protein WBJ81_03435 [Rickettsiales bacterium]